MLESRFRQNAAARQLVDFERGQLKMRSAVASRYLLQEVVDASLTVDVLIEMAHAIDSGRSVDQSLVVSLMRFSNVEALLPKENRLPSIVRYYERVKKASRGAQ